MTDPFDDATRAQIEAARPDASTWLAANAGSGKTRVLTDRVARLLLNGVEPQQILCLTYTKAAASEMQNRLFRRLGEWAMLDDTALVASLRQLGIESAFTPEALRQARTLFALAIEAPGGLKIQTIHSFCASILRRFPLEARVSPQFTEIEDRAADLLRADIVDSMAEGEDASLVAEVARYYTGEDFARLTRSIVGRRDAFETPMAREGILDLLGAAPSLTEEELAASVFQGGEGDLIAALVPALLAKGGNDAKAGAVLQGIRDLDLGALPALESVLLNGAGAVKAGPFTAKIDTFPTKPTRERLADLMPELNDLMARVEAARPARLALLAADRSAALHRFAARFLSRYAAEKEKRGWLDFDDLILKTRALLSDKSVAAWVLYRIDGGIDHILVDEAQDTSPRQWDVIEKLTDDFHSGSGARSDVARTLFVVGDRKQSIYSFQGADPLEFDRKARVFEDKITAAGQMFQHRSLDYSFRSSSAILRLVDAAFDPTTLPDFEKQTLHKAFKHSLPGRVDLWPVVEAPEKEEDSHWTDPVDRRAPNDPSVILANRIADQIRTLTTQPHFIPQDGPDGMLVKRRIQPGDFLILVQSRSALFSEVIRACKAAGLPIAGADRLKVGAELAVKDLGALLSFLATPDDDLSLATALRSPLFGWTERELFQAANARPNGALLWQALRGRDQDFPQTLAMLHDLRGQVDYMRPYDLIERILTRHGGRTRLLSRLGPEAEDGINAMLSQALSYERGNVPSLTGFLEWMQTDALEIKRQVDSASNQIRVMTVHGAKGLEAPIVILPDTGGRPNVVKDDIITLDGVPVWKPPADLLPPPVEQRLELMKGAQYAERLRLLYVALTRAEKWLIIAAIGKMPEANRAWYQIVEDAMGGVNAAPVGTDGTQRFEEWDWDALPVMDVPEKTQENAALEPVFTQHAPPHVPRITVVSPSALGGAKALPGDAGAEEEKAKAYGSLVHSLLETRPSIDSEEEPDPSNGLDPNLVAQAREEAQAVLSDPAFADVFAPDTLAEVAITAEIGGIPFYGLIDRLIVTGTTVLAVDFKTNRVTPDDPEACPEGLLRQMGAYARMLARIYPDLEVQTALLWTRSRQLMPLPPALVQAAFDRAPHLDGGALRS